MKMKIIDLTSCETGKLGEADMVITEFTQEYRRGQRVRYRKADGCILVGTIDMVLYEAISAKMNLIIA